MKKTRLIPKMETNRLTYGEIVNRWLLVKLISFFFSCNIDYYIKPSGIETLCVYVNQDRLAYRHGEFTSMLHFLGAVKELLEKENH